jgi:hypothetical protein
MTRVLHHLKSNVIAYLALFIALGGTSYAAIRLPTGSVGTREIRNGAVTPKKLSKFIAGYTADWAFVGSDGRVIASRPRARARYLGNGNYYVSWGRTIPAGCIAVANTANTPLAAGSSSASVSGLDGRDRAKTLLISTFGAGGSFTPESFDVLVICG